jgi:serine/threonine protein kinase/Tol biopolymer transport system component
MFNWVGETLGNYRIEAQLGSGGMGRVYRGVHIHINRAVAIKVLHDHLAADETFQARFLREAQAAAALNHTNIVSVTDFNEDQGVYYLVMELVQDGSLRDLLQQHAREGRTLPLGQALDLIRQAAEGLHYAHEHGMVHRDIKPDNLMLQRDTATGGYLLKITDFGLARLADATNLTIEGQAMGTPAYMSPEQCQGLELDNRSDIYSLGVVLFEVVTGYVPFESKVLSEAVYKHVHSQPPSPLEIRPDLPPQLSAIILRCLAKDPGARYATAGDLAAALRAFVPASPAAVTPSSVATVASERPLRVALDREHISIAPGEPATLTITLANPGTHPVQVSVAIDGIPREWISRPPSNVQIAPGAELTGPVRIRLPHDLPPGVELYPIVVRATVRDDPTLRAQAIAQIAVRGVPASHLTLTPAIAQGSRSVSYQVAVHNNGTAPDVVTPLITPDHSDLHVVWEPRSLTVDSGQVATTRLTLGASPRWFARDNRIYGFELSAGEGRGVPPLRGQFVQVPAAPFWLLPIFGVLLALVIAGGAYAMLGGGDDEDVVAAGSTPAPAQPTAPADEQTPVPLTADATATAENGSALSIAAEPTATDAAPEPTATPEPQPAPELTPTAVIEPEATATPAESDAATATPDPFIDLRGQLAFSAARNLDDPDGQLDIYLMSPDGSNQRPLISEPDDDWLPAWSPDGTRIAWVSRQHGNHQLYIANADGSDIQRLVTSSADDLHPAWSPDGTQILFQRVDQGVENLFLVTVEDGGVQQLTNDPGADGWAVWSPDGLRIAWAGERGGNRDIYVLDMTNPNAAPLRLTGDPSFDYSPSWSLGGERIAFASNRSGNFDIYIVDATGLAEPVRVTTSPSDEVDPLWSPDGRMLAFIRRNSTNADLVVMTGGTQQRVIATNASPSDPGLRWSPDSTRITYVSEEAGNYDIWLAFVDGSPPLRLTDDPLDDANVAWFPMP